MNESVDTSVIAAPDLSRRLGRSEARAGSLALDVATVSGVSLALGLFRLGTPSLWVDEAFTAREMEESLTRYLNVYHFLYYSLLKPWVELVGTAEWALRLPSVFAAMLASALLVVLGRRLFDRWVGLTAGLLLASSPFVVQWSQQARGYTFVLALAVLATLLLLRALDRNTAANWALYGLAFAAVVVWHPVPGLLLAPSHAVLALQRRERFLPHGLLSVVIVMALGVPWAAQIAMRSIGEDAAMNWLKAPSVDVAATTLLDVSGAAGFGAALALLGLWLVQRGGNRDVALWMGTWALAPFVVALIVSVERPIYLDRYLISAAPAFALLAAVALMGVARRYRVALVVPVFVATVVGLTQWYGTNDGNWRGEDWRSAVAAVQERRGEADDLIIIPWWSYAAATYYGADVKGSSTADSIWVLNWSETGGDIPVDVRRSFGFGNHVRVERLQFGWRVSAQLWQRPG